MRRLRNVYGRHLRCRLLDALSTANRWIMHVDYEFKWKLVAATPV